MKTIKYIETHFNQDKTIHHFFELGEDIVRVVYNHGVYSYFDEKNNSIPKGEDTSRILWELGRIIDKELINEV